MSDEELQRLRQQRLQEMQNAAIKQQQENQVRAQQEAIYQQQKAMLLLKILSSEARARLENLKLAKKEFAERLEMELIQLFQAGYLQRSFSLPMSDGDFKQLLIKSQQKNNRKTNIRIF